MSLGNVLAVAYATQKDKLTFLEEKDKVTFSRKDRHHVEMKAQNANVFSGRTCISSGKGLLLRCRWDFMSCWVMAAGSSLFR